MSELERELGLDESRDRRARRVAIGLAVALHLALLFAYVDVSRSDEVYLPAATGAVNVTRIDLAPPPPPTQVKQRRPPQKTDAKVPDPRPDEVEPVIEPDILPPEDIPEGPIVIGEVAAPTFGQGKEVGPFSPGTEGVSEPILIESSYVRPIYPPEAFRQRVPGNVVLRAVVTKGGEVTQLQVIYELPKGQGFAQSAMLAARQWRYRPGMKDGAPVDVLMTINVTFNIESY